MKWAARLKAKAEGENPDLQENATAKNCDNPIFAVNHSTVLVPIPKSDEELIVGIVRDCLNEPGRRISEFNAIDAYNAKLEQVRNDPELSAKFDELCEERIAILIHDGGRTEEEAELYVRDIRYLTEALMHF
ncbi:MAG: hypothetical protein IPG22_20415 [Acidobacteria bacterium]|nr:hypothetical protein [Acidobacteriota bacterium]